MRNIYKILVLVLIFVSVIIYNKNQSDFEIEILHFNQVAQIEKVLGAPKYVYKRQSQFGKSIISDTDFLNGTTVRVYLVQKYPAKFLVVTVAKDETTVIRSIFEDA